LDAGHAYFRAGYGDSQILTKKEFAMKLRLQLIVITAVFIVSGALMALSGCGDDDDDDDGEVGSGTLEFYANGEEFIRDGFIGKTGWAIEFDHFYVNLLGPTAYQVAESNSEALTAKHAGHPHEDIPEGAAHEALTDIYYLDLHEGDGPQLVDAVSDAPAGNYNYSTFSITQAQSGEYAGYSIIMAGSAAKDEEVIDFTIKLTEQMTFTSCHQEVDDEFAGVVEDGGTGSVEMTFHSDHLFGDADEALDDPLSVNPGAVGFQPFADMAVAGVLDIDQLDMAANMDPDTFGVFLAALYTLGHSGEGHCGYSAF
jgi:hypothetical protein